MSEPKVKLGLVSNVWSKQMVFEKAGDVEQGHSHCFDHMTLLAYGKLSIKANGKSTEFAAPNMIYIRAGVEHELTALQDGTVAYCIHAIRDGERIEDIVDPSMIPDGTDAHNYLNCYNPLISEGKPVLPDFLDSRAV